jgi:STE24 endopeptidase
MFLDFMAAAATGFDAEAATRAYLATVNGAARAKSDAYFEGGYWILLWGALIAIAADLAILHFGFARSFRDWAERRTKRRWLQPALFALPYILLSTIALLPWTLYTGYVREVQYGMANQSLGEWFADQGKGLGVGLIFSAILLAVVFAVIRRSPKRWWLWGALSVSALSAFAAMIIPIFLAPLFNSYTELPQGPVRDRIVAMAKAHDVPADHIYLFDASKQTKRISANVSGLGPTVRVSLNDNLLNRTSLPETASVMGHELGHYVLGHIPRLILIVTTLFLAAFWLLSRIAPMLIERYGARWGVRGVDDPAVVPIFGIIISVFGLLATPITNTIIRVNESEADAFGLEAAREPDGFATTALKLGEYRKLEPGAVEEFLFYDHPSGRTRIRMAMDWKAKQLAQGGAK